MSRPGSWLGELVGRPELWRAADAEEPHGIAAGARRIADVIGRWRRGTAPGRWVGTMPGDVIVRAGELATLAVRVGQVPRLADTVVRFAIDGAVVGTSPVRNAAHVEVFVPAPAPGLHEVGATLCTGAGHPLLPTGTAAIRVVGAEPVLAVDAVDVLAADPQMLAALARLRDSGIVTVVVDTWPVDRTDAIHDAVRAAGLPRMIVLSHPVDAAGFPTLGVDFSGVFLVSTLRRLRAGGAAVVGLLSSREATSGGARLPPELPMVPAGELLADPAVLRATRERAATFERRRVELGEGARWQLAERLDAPALPGHRVQVELDNHRARERLFALVEGARRSIDLELYLLAEDRVAQALAARLVQRARAGVRVRVLLDALYSGQEVLGVRNALATALAEEPGIDVIARRPIHSDALERRLLKHRDHRKLVIVDECIALVGGRNLAEAYYTGFDEIAVTDATPGRFVPWFDAHVEVEGPLVAPLVAAFHGAWTAEAGAPTADPPARTAGGAAHRPGTVTCRLWLHDGLGDDASLGVYEALIAAARRRIVLVTDFPIVEVLEVALRRALARGVEVIVLTGNAVPRRGDGTMLPDTWQREVFEYLTKSRFEPLIAAGVQVFEYVAPANPLVVCRGGAVRPYVHAKLLSIDGTVASIGSANFDATASFWEREVGVVIEDATVVADLEAQLDAAIASSHRIVLDSADWRRDALQRAVVARLWPDALYS